MLFLPNVNVPAGESIWCPPLGPHSTNGSASLMLYPLVQVTVIYHVINNQALVQREKDEWTCIGSQTTITRALHWQKQVQSLNLLHSKISLVPAEGRRAPLDFQTSLCLRQQSASAITVQNKSSSNTIQTIRCQYTTQKKKFEKTCFSLTAERPPLKSANAKSALWLISCSFKDPFPLLL